MTDPADLPGIEVLGPVRAMGRRCAVHTHREDVPLHGHHVHPLGAGGPDEPGNIVTLCANGHYSVHDLLAKADRYVIWEAIPWKIRRRYGWKVRRLAKRGFDAMLAAEEQG